MQRGLRSWLVLVTLAVAASACTEGSGANATTTITIPTTEFVPVTTSPTPVSTDRPSPLETSPPTVILPRRPGGIAALELDAEELLELQILRPTVIAVLPHDRTAITEGLHLLSDSVLLESTGFYGRSSRRMIDLNSGDLGTVNPLAPELYGTGIAVAAESSEGFGYQFTRLEERVVRFRLDDLTVDGYLSLEAEVSGACSRGDGQIFISTSEGSLQILSGADLTVGEATVPALGDNRLPPLLDLACTEGSIWAVVGSLGVIAELDAQTGAVLSLADLSELTPAGLAETDSLSGIAYRPTSDTWFVTGKRWDVLYEISLTP